MSIATTWPTATLGMETRYVDADAYCRLLTSRRFLERMDDHARGLRGVVDPVACVRYVVNERTLARCPRLTGADAREAR